MHRLRLALPADAYEIAALSRGVVEVGLRGWSWHPQRVARAIRARDTNVAVASDEYHLIGAAIMEFGDTNAHLSLLAVHPSHQRRGIGREIMRWLEETALTAGITAIDLELRANNYGARSFYHALGYRETYWIRGYYLGIETAVQMTHKIGRAVQDRIT